MEDELTEIYRKVINYLKNKRKKIIGWVLFLFGIYSIIRGFFKPINLIWSIPFTIVGGVILKQELKKLASFLKPYLIRITSLGRALLILGLILVIVGIALAFPLPNVAAAFGGWGIFFIILGIPLTATNLILKHHIIDNWAYLIEGAQGKAEEIFKGTEDSLKASRVSSIEMERRELMPGVLRGIFGRRREFLVVKDKHFRLKPYQLLVNARDYGNNLDVVWYLTYRLSFIRALLTIIPFISFIPKTITDLDVFDLQDLTAYNTVCHHSVLSAVEKLMLSLNQDPSKIERKSRGFLGIS